MEENKIENQPDEQLPSGSGGFWLAFVMLVMVGLLIGYELMKHR